MINPKVKIAINSRLIDKNEAGEKSLFVEGWQNVELTTDELADAIGIGIAYTAQHRGRRKAANFAGCDVLSVDIDRGMTVEQALGHPLIAEQAAFLYTTARHAHGAPRFRVLFVAPRTISDAQEMRAALRSLALRLGGDPSATDPARIFYGNSRAQVTMIGRRITEPMLDELIAQSKNAQNGGADGASSVMRSALTIRAELPVRLPNGRVLAFSQISAGTAVHCPFHVDEHASAFITRSRNGVPGIHCSACASTYWPPSDVDEIDFFHFDRAARRAREYFEQHRDFGPLGMLANSPLSQIGLIGCNIGIGEGPPAPPTLLPGLSLIKSPKGTGKTEALKWLVAGLEPVLLVGHRRSLIRQSCARLGLSCYLDPEGRYDRLGVCFDSLDFIPEAANP